jgi:hypothetical protein
MPTDTLVSDQDVELSTVRLTPDERHAVQRQWGWRPEGDGTMTGGIVVPPLV